MKEGGWVVVIVCVCVGGGGGRAGRGEGGGGVGGLGRLRGNKMCMGQAFGSFRFFIFTKMYSGGISLIHSLSPTSPLPAAFFWVFVLACGIALYTYIYIYICVYIDFFGYYSCGCA